jgi:ABC-type uncharacterized transport system fused permease/ATPase subunit
MGSPQNSIGVNAIQDEGDDGDISKPFKLIARLIKQWFFTAGEKGTGRWEAVGMVGLCLSRAYEFKLQTRAVRWMESTLTTRNLAEFKVGLVRVALLNFGGAALRILYSYLQARITWKWRGKLTDHVHDAYFSAKAFYFIGEGGGVAGSKMIDADNRIVEDMKVTAQAFSDCFSDVIFTSTEGVFYTWNLYQLFGYKMAVLPYVYTLATFLLVNKVSPARKRWKRLGNQRMAAYAAYRGRQQQLMLQSEAVAALRGAEYENGFIMHNFEDFRSRTSTLFWEYYKFGAVNSFIAGRLANVVFVPAMAIAPGVWFPKHGTIDTIDKMKEVRADVGVQWLLLNRTMEASSRVVEIVRKLEELVGQVSRVTDLMELLDSVQEFKQGEYAKNFCDGDMISFDDVTIVTPASPPVTLVEHLSFTLKVGGSILLTGHNGAGKSSIFRCMGGLWDIPTGVITKPGGASNAGLHREVFYLPQKPYNVLGTLVDQMTYPDESGAAKNLGRDALFQILAQVDLGYLVDRAGVLVDEVNWEDELSLGEKQRLAIARLIYHRPRFAILDECTSAVSREMERRLYAICEEHSITYVTISHRPALLAYHDQRLAIGDGKCGFTLTAIDRAKHATSVLALARASVVDSDTENSIKRHLEARSEPYAALQVAPPLPERSNMERIKRLWTLGRPEHLGKQLLTMLAFFGVQYWLLAFRHSNEGRMFEALMNQNRRLMVRLLCNAGAMAFSVAWTVETFLYIQKEMAASFSAKIARALQTRYIANNMFYKLYHHDGRIKDADQRLGEDIRQFGDNFTDIVIWGVRPLGIVILSSVRIASFMGWKVLMYLFLYFAAAVWALKKAAPNYKELYQEMSRLEGRFAFVHARVKACAESIAFFDGGEREKCIVGDRFRELMVHDWKRNWVNFKFRIVEDIFRGRLPDIVQWVLRFAYGYLYFTDASVLADRGAAMFTGQVQLAAMTSMLFGHVGIILQQAAEPWATLTGKVARVCELDEIMTELEQAAAAGAAGPSRGTVEASEAGVVTFAGVDIVTPRGLCVARAVSVEVSAAQPLMVTGASATGKSSLFRVLGGLWPLRAGVLGRPGGGGGADIVLVPQRIHMAPGTLADQVTYPEKIEPGDRSAEKTAELQELLDLVGVGYLVTRWAGDAEGKQRAEHKGWDHVTQWHDVLSLGEQQRIGMSRLFYHRPKIGVLDECTSAVSLDVEARLYRTAAARGIACITLSQRLALEEFHVNELRLGANTPDGWQLCKIEGGAAEQAPAHHSVLHE